jgi:Ca-activated chloride channel family protein
MSIKYLDNLWLLLFTALWCALLVWHSLKELRQRRQAFASAKMLSRIAGHKPTQRPAYKWFITFLALALIGVGLLRPQGQLEEEQVKGEGLDLVVALDVSTSMKANDIDGNTRLDAARAILKKMVQGLKNDRLGLIVFAGETMVQSPVSYDKNTFITFLDRADPSIMAIQGTNMAAAIQTSIDRFDMTASQSKVILMVSDGEDHNVEELNKAIDEAVKKKIPIFTLGIGSYEGGRIPESRDWFGRISYKTHKGRVVVTKLDESTLKDIAKKTGGKYFRAHDVSSANKVIGQLSGIKRVAVSGGTIMVKKEYFYFPVLLAFLLLLLEWVVSERVHYEREKDHWLKRL